MSRWPDDLKAIQKMMLAFFEHIATRVMADIKATVVGGGTNDSETADKAQLNRRDRCFPPRYDPNGRRWC